MAEKKIAILLHGLYGGGAERVLLNLAIGILERDFQVDLVLVRAEGPYLQEVPETIRLVDLKASRVLSSLPALVKYLKTERPKAMLSALHTNIVAIWANRLAGTECRLVVSEHNTLSSVKKGKKDLRWKIFPFLAGIFYPWANEIIAVSSGVADDLSKTANISRDKIRVVYNPVINKEIQQKADEKVTHPWLLPGQPPVLLAIGRLTEQKDFLLLIKAFEKVHQTRNIKLIILGEGELRSRLEALIQQLGLQEDVSLPGFVDNPYSYMQHSSLFVLSSKWEGLPTVLIEALFCGLPIVSTDCPNGPREILRGGAYGRLVPVGDCDALARAINLELDNSADNHSDECWRPYTLDTVVNQYIGVLLGS